MRTYFFYYQSLPQCPLPRFQSPRRHYGDASSAQQRILDRPWCCSVTSIELKPDGPKIEAAGRVEARRAENGGRRPILWQRSSGQGAYSDLSACTLKFWELFRTEATGFLFGLTRLGPLWVRFGWVPISNRLSIDRLGWCACVYNIELAGEWWTPLELH